MPTNIKRKIYNPPIYITDEHTCTGAKYGNDTDCYNDIIIKVNYIDKNCCKEVVVIPDDTIIDNAGGSTKGSLRLSTIWNEKGTDIDTALQLPNNKVVWYGSGEVEEGEEEMEIVSIDNWTFDLDNAGGGDPPYAENIVKNEGQELEQGIYKIKHAVYDNSTNEDCSIILVLKNDDDVSKVVIKGKPNVSHRINNGREDDFGGADTYVIATFEVKKENGRYKVDILNVDDDYQIAQITGNDIN